MSLYERRYEGRCHICQFIQVESEMGELLEAWLLDPSHDDQSICDFFNGKFGMER